MTKRLIIALTAVAVSLAAGSAVAIDAKRYPGVTCRHMSGTMGVFGGTIYNSSSTSELEVICPLVLDTGTIASGRVTFYDRNSSVGNSCTIFSETPRSDGTGGVDQDFEVVSTTAGETSANPLDKSFGAIGAGDYYYAYCSIARTSGGNASDIAAISISEN